MNKKRALALCIIFAIALLLIPPFGINISAAYTISGGIVIIDEDLVAAEGNEFIIEGDVFSVTVIGDVDVSIIFNNVTIDRSADSAGTNVAGIYTAGQRLNWTRGYNSFYVPTCPLLITGGANVTARFDGTCTFKAGTSGWYAASDNTLLLDSTNRGGYAGIQVDGDSSLTISGAENLIAYGAYQTQNSSTSAGSGKPSGLTGTNNRGGGAGIGGGTSYTSPSAATSSYTQGTPGTIIIDNGNVTAYGGFQAAGIGGGTNSAATTNKIEINGGVVTAHGGAWAAGIGEGDSVDGAASNLFNSEENTYEVVINGGVVTAYGGYSAAAIGTTDAITNGNSFSVGTTSGLSITITGGNITATSGETSTDSLTAAIGAGQNTDMEDNSITIYNEAKIVAASFSRYAISNYGYSTDTPSVNIDPEGYVYLARFGSVTKERTFKVYAIHKNANGHFMYVPTASHDISDGSIDSATMPYYYAYDPGHVSSDGTRIGGFYLVDKDGANVVPSDYADNPEDYLYDKDTKRYYPTTIPAVSAYYDTETIIEEITVPGNYKAVAITLPNPNEYGGSYVLEVPQASGNPIYVLMQKDHPGVTSGEVENASQTHYSAGSNPPSEANSTPNITIDGTARPFTDLDVGIYEGGAAQPTLIPEFTDTVYGYTFYVPHGTERFWLDFSFASSYTDEYGNAVSAKIILLTLDGVNQGFDSGSTSILLSDLNIGSDGKANVWIKKTDTTIVSGSTKTVSYKVTIVVKDKYAFLLNVDALDKIYDGNPVEPSFTALLEGAGYSTTVEKGALTTTYSPKDTDSDGARGSLSLSYWYTVYYTISNVSIDENGTVTYTATFTYNTYNNSYTQDYTFTVDKDGNISSSAGTRYIDCPKNGNYYYRIAITYNNGNMTLQLQSSKNQSSWSTTNTSNLPLSVSVTHNFVTSTDLSAVESSLKDKIAANGTTSESTTFYGYKELGTAVYSVTLGSISDTYNVTYTSTGNAMVTVSYSQGTNLTSKMTQEEKDAITYTFYEDSDGDGTYETLLGLDAPKNAGRYVVHAFLESQKYEAEGQALFVIYKKEIHIVAIANWLKYVTTSELVSYDGVIAEPGDIYFEGVISGETVALQAGASFGYVDTGNLGYADDVNYNDQKIKITNTVLNSASQVNYTLTGVVDGVCYVPGQIAYSSSGTLFRKEGSNTSLWRKFYPVEETDYLTWITSDGAFTDSRVDYHSPVPNGANAENDYSGGTVGIHREYVKLRTTGDTSARYSVDIEFGAMQYQYTKRVWNVNTGEYEGVEGESKWNGHNGTNNAVTVTNRSNSQIYYKVEFEIDFMYAAITEGADSGIRAALFDTNGALVAGTQVGEKITSTSGKSDVQVLLSAAPPDPTGVGTAHSKTYLLVLSGVPSSITEDNNINYTNVGSITVTII
ncbi:MAG: hypothetical protein J6D11_05440 [Clostridia bacterium]|nr:hypothetical protein [Clostridia bacterium]